MQSKNNIIYVFIVAFFACFLSIDLKNVASLSLAINVASSSYSLIVLFLFLLSLLSTYQNKRYIKRPDSKVLKRFMFFVYGMSVFFSLWTSLGNRISYILIILPYILFLFMYVSCYSVSDKIRNISLVLIYIFLIYVYMQEYTKVIALAFNEDATTNASYFVLYLLPLVLCVEVKWIRILSVIAAIVVVVSSSKRGGTIAVLLASIVFFITEYFFIKEKKINLGIIVFGVITAAIVIYGSSYIQELTVFGRIENLADDEGSGRMDIYRHTLVMIADANIFNFFLGHGWNRVVGDSALHLSAHNDFLEVMYDFGLIGLILYVSLYFFLIRKGVRLIKTKSQYASAMLVSIALFFVNSLFSHIIIYPAYFCSFTMCWGYIFGMERKYLISSK